MRTNRNPFENVRPCVQVSQAKDASAHIVKTCNAMCVQVVQSKQPGYFHYHKVCEGYSCPGFPVPSLSHCCPCSHVNAQAPPSVERLESSGAVPAKVKEIDDYEVQISQLKAEAESLRRAATAAMVAASTTTSVPTRPSSRGATSGTGVALLTFLAYHRRVG